MDIGVVAPVEQQGSRGIARSIGGRLKAISRLVPTSGATREILAVDGLRALAIVLVVLHHVNTRALSRQWPVGSDFFERIADWGFSGVDLFFVLSGFLLFLPFARAILSGAPLPSTKKFYVRRMLRILPLYLFALCTLLLFAGTVTSDGEQIPSLLLAGVLLHDTTHASTALVQNVNIVFWTLAIEWQFYLLLPWIARAIRRFAGRTSGRALYLRIGVALGALVAWGLSIRTLTAILWFHYGIFPLDAPNGLGILYGIVSGVQGKQLETFALGMGLSVIYIVGVERGRLTRVWGAVLGTCAFVAAIAGLAGSVFWGTQAPGTASNTNQYSWIFGVAGPSWTILGAWVLGVCFALLVFSVLMGPRILRQFFALAPLRYIGVISYSIYVWHLPIINSLAAAMPNDSPNGYLWLSIKAWIAILIYCSASYFIIERPFFSLRRAAHSRSELQLAEAATGVVAAP